MRQLLEAGVHYGHQTQRWNPRMGEFIYGDRNGIHILDLTQTVPMLDAALKVVRDTVAKGERVSLIQFGSRVDIYLPLQSQITVALGDRVVGGETVVARIGS